MALKKPDDPNEARRVVYDTLSAVRNKLNSAFGPARIPQGFFDDVANEVMATYRTDKKHKKR